MEDVLMLDIVKNLPRTSQVLIVDAASVETPPITNEDKKTVLILEKLPLTELIDTTSIVDTPVINTVER
jgi:hypothetical protein